MKSIDSTPMRRAVSAAVRRGCANRRRAPVPKTTTSGSVASTISKCSTLSMSNDETGGLDPALRKTLTEAFLRLDPHDPEQRAIMALQRTVKFIPTKPENYAGIEAAARTAGLIK